MTDDQKPAVEKDVYFFFRYRPAFFAGFEPPPDQAAAKPGMPPPLPELRPSIRFWTTHPADTSVNYGSKLRPWRVDLCKTPSSKCAADKVEVDDHVNVHDGFTTMGPSHPHAYGAAGVYLRLLTLKSPAVIPPQDGDKIDKIPTDQTAIVHRGPLGEVRRYHGFVGLCLTKPCAEALDPKVPGAQATPPHNLWVVYHPGTGSTHRVRPPRKLVIPEAVQLATPFKRVKDSGVAPEIIDLLRVKDDGHVEPEPEPKATGADNPPDGAGKPSDERAIYLERDYALYTAAMNVPKKPSGCSEAEQAGAAAQPPAPASPAELVLGGEAGDPAALELDHRGHWGRDLDNAPRSILNVVSADSGCLSSDRQSVIATGEVDIIATMLKSHPDSVVVLEAGETLFDALSRHAQTAKQTFDYLDLIGHSRADDNILKLGEFALTSRVASREFSMLVNSGILDQLGIKAIRLLGCRTACSPRGRHVVATILKFFDGADPPPCPAAGAPTPSAPPPRYPVYATRADLFSVHFDQLGLRREAETLLADSDVITSAGPGDLPPGDDYPPDPPSDDDDDDDYEPVPPPSEFSISALSDCNAALVAADSYQYWNKFSEHYEALRSELRFDLPIQDNPLRRATREVLVSIGREPRAIEDLRSFDIILEDEAPRIRVYTSRGDAYSFAFRSRSCVEVRKLLEKMEIDCDLTSEQSTPHRGLQLSPGLNSWI